MYAPVLIQELFMWNFKFDTIYFKSLDLNLIYVLHLA